MGNFARTFIKLQFAEIIQKAAVNGYSREDIHEIFEEALRQKMGRNENENKGV